MASWMGGLYVPNHRRPVIRPRQFDITSRALCTCFDEGVKGCPRHEAFTYSYLNARHRKAL